MGPPCTTGSTKRACGASRPPPTSSWAAPSRLSHPASPVSWRSPVPEDAEQIREAVVSRYGRLAEAAAAGERITDCGPGDRRFGAAAYDDAAGQLPEDA